MLQKCYRNVNNCNTPVTIQSRLTFDICVSEGPVPWEKRSGNKNYCLLQSILPDIPNFRRACPLKFGLNVEWNYTKVTMLNSHTTGQNVFKTPIPDVYKYYFLPKGFGWV